MGRGSVSLACTSDAPRFLTNGYRLSMHAFALVRMLLDIRFFVGRFFGWDQDPAATSWETFATRLTDADRSNSLAAAGFFRVVYPFENEQLAELIDRTAHTSQR